MKKHLFLVLILTVCSVSFAQETKMSAGLGLEWNMASRHNFAGGTVLNFIYNLPGSSALGLSVTGSMNFNHIYVFEPAFHVRHYFFQGLLPGSFPHAGFFLQFGIGTFVALEDQGTTTMIMSGLAGGFRLPLGTSLFVEPFGRLGYPFAFGLGAMGGIRF